VSLAPAEALVRWRLMLGEAAHAGLGGPGLTADEVAADAAMAWLYDREGDLQERDVRTRQGGTSGSGAMTVPDWINDVHRLFPKETIERLERDAVERYRVEEIVTSAEVLERVLPSPALLQAVLRTKHLMNPQVLALARDLARKVVEDLLKRLRREVEKSFRGRRDPRRSTPHRSAQDLDAKKTIRRNLRRWSTAEKRLYIERPYFVGRTRRNDLKWQLILLVDESGSMMGSVIHAAVTAACLWGLPTVKTHLCIFDTEVVDLTAQVTDPVEILMKVQLGGGTDIQKAVGYAQGLVENPRRTIVVLITDFFEGGSPDLLVQRVRALCEQGTIVLGLAALDEEAAPSYDRELGQRLVDVGAKVGAMTPGQLAAFVADVVKP
jgi:uncharacterized protein with von Willebrand factor type A (vWA) domain